MTEAARLRALLAAIRDPEIRVLSIEELGILQSVDIAADGVPVITIRPTYAGCPAMESIRADIRAAVLAAGHCDVHIETEWSPAWSTDAIHPRSLATLTAAGIAPPVVTVAAVDARQPPRPVAAPPCPRCAAADTEEITRFGSTACKSLWRCRCCLEPFEHLKKH